MKSLQRRKPYKPVVKVIPGLFEDTGIFITPVALNGDKLPEHEVPMAHLTIKRGAIWYEEAWKVKGFFRSRWLDVRIETTGASLPGYGHYDTTRTMRVNAESSANDGTLTFIGPIAL